MPALTSHRDEGVHTFRSTTVKHLDSVLNFTLAVEQRNNVKSVYGQPYRAVRKVSDAISITHFYWCSVIVTNKLHLSC